MSNNMLAIAMVIAFPGGSLVMTYGIVAALVCLN